MREHISSPTDATFKTTAMMEVYPSVKMIEIRFSRNNPKEKMYTLDMVKIALIKIIVLYL